MMQPTSTRSSEDEKLIEQEKTIDIEANIPINHGLLPTPTFDDASHSFPNQPKRRSVFHVLLSYPTSGSLELNPTSWLDGVRGVAALGVYLFHITGCWAALVPAWHSDPNQNNILQIPLLRSFFASGPAAVSVFFVLSGYVLTHKSLRWIRGGKAHLVYPSVASSMFRRGFRLYLPPIFLTFCEMLATRFGLSPPLNFTFVPEVRLAAQIRDWFMETNYLLNPAYNFNLAIHGQHTRPKYDPVVWTIPLEFYGSFLCYFLLLLIARIRNNKLRMGLVAGLSVVSMMRGSWNFFCFLAGMLIADFNLGQEQTETVPPTMSRSKRLTWMASFLAAFYLAGFPSLEAPETSLTPMLGFETLRSLIPTALNLDDPSRFWWSASGVLFLLSISQLPSLKRVFETNLCQYLGKISFSLYLIHMFCIVIFGLNLQKFLLGIAGLQPHAGTVLYLVMCGIWYLVFTLLVFGLAGVFERVIDRPSVAFARWVEGRCLRCCGYLKCVQTKSM